MEHGKEVKIQKLIIHTASEKSYKKRKFCHNFWLFMLCRKPSVQVMSMILDGLMYAWLWYDVDNCVNYPGQGINGSVGCTEGYRLDFMQFLSRTVVLSCSSNYFYQMLFMLPKCQVDYSLQRKWATLSTSDVSKSRNWQAVALHKNCHSTMVNNCAITCVRAVISEQ